RPSNASSVHAYGREARKFVEEARAQVASLINADENQIIFNNGATEGNNTVLKHFAGQRILTSGIEHPSVLEPVPQAEKINMLRNGLVDLEHLEKLLKQEKTALVSVMFANNETGAIQPVSDIAELCKRYGAFYHCDAVQAAGKISVGFK